MKDVETKVKSAFTRAFNKCGLPVKTTIMVEDAKKSKGVKKAAPAEPDDPEIGGELAEVWPPNYQVSAHVISMTAESVLYTCIECIIHQWLRLSTNT